MAKLLHSQAYTFSSPDDLELAVELETLLAGKYTRRVIIELVDTTSGGGSVTFRREDGTAGVGASASSLGWSPPVEIDAEDGVYVLDGADGDTCTLNIYG